MPVPAEGSEFALGREPAASVIALLAGFEGLLRAEVIGDEFVTRAGFQIMDSHAGAAMELADIMEDLIQLLRRAMGT